MSEARRRLWVDTDIALGATYGDIDDGHALAAVACAPEIELLGVSVVAGNTDARTAQHCAGALLAACGRGGVEVLAADAAAAAIAALPAGSELLALGPLSNIAAALRQQPALGQRARLHTVTGLHRGWRRPWLYGYDLNARRDPAALHAARAGFARNRHYSLDVVCRLRLGPAELQALAAHGAVGQYLARHSQRWQAQALWRYASRRFPVWDLVAALSALGRLPGARFDDQQRLSGFDPAAALESYFALLPG